MRAALHLHGYWEQPELIILTEEDYAERYGLTTPTDPAAGGGALADPGDLDTFHRKVVWTLLTTRPVMFVGFSVEDPAFQLMLRFVHEDFHLAPNPSVHFAVLPSYPADGGQRDRDAARLAEFGALPVFYDVVTDAAGN